MPRFNYTFDESTYIQRVKEGRGQGRGVHYKPWLKPQDFPSRGLTSRVPGRKSGRTHVLFSQNESRLCYLLDWDINVLDIREQFPLDREATRSIAKDLGVQHPRDPVSGVDIVMTTDFVVDIRTPSGVRLRPLAVKPESELKDPRVLEKLEIERRLWKSQSSLPLLIVTDRDIPVERATNIENIMDASSLKSRIERYPGYWADHIDRLLAIFQRTPRRASLKQFLNILVVQHHFEEDLGMLLIRHLVANGRLLMDMNMQLDGAGPLSQLSLAEPAVVVTGKKFA